MTSYAYKIYELGSSSGASFSDYTLSLCLLLAFLEEICSYHMVTVIIHKTKLNNFLPSHLPHNKVGR